MKYDDLVSFILSFGRELFLEDENNLIINKLCSIADANDIHYLWSNFNSPQFVVQNKISCNQNEYHGIIEKVFTEENYLMIIDSCCFADCDKHVILQLCRSDLIDILTRFYWELDEVYISNNDLDWFIAINHNFEMVLYCKNSSSDYYREKIMSINKTHS